MSELLKEESDRKEEREWTYKVKRELLLKEREMSEVLKEESDRKEEREWTYSEHYVLEG